MEENEGKDLAVNEKEELLEKIKQLEERAKEVKGSENVHVKYYDKVPLQIGDSLLEVSIAEIEEVVRDEKDENEQKVITYDIYMQYDDQDVLIGKIDENGDLTLNEETLKQIDPENRLGLQGLSKEDTRADVSILKEMEGKTKEELEEELDKEKDDKTKDTNGDSEKENDEKVPQNDDELDKEEIAEKKNISKDDVYPIRRDSQFYENHLNVPKTTYFYRDSSGVFHAEFINDKGEPEPSPFFGDSTTHLQEKVVSIGDDGDPVKETMPYQVMTTKELNNQGSDVRDVRIAIHFGAAGTIEIEEIRQGTDGKWAGVGDIETRGREYNTSEVNELSNTRTSDVTPDKINDSYQVAKDSDLGADGVQLDELSPERMIEKFVDEGYQREEAEKIYGLIVGDKHLPEEEAKKRVNEEIEKNQKKQEKEKDEDPYEKVPWPTY